MNGSSESGAPAMRSDYPEFMFEQTDQAHPGFVKLISDAVTKLDFDGPGFTDAGRHFLRETRQVGSYVTLKAIQEIDQRQDRYGPTQYAEACGFVGDAVFEEIAKDDLIGYLPWNNVDIAPHGHVLRVIFRKLIETAEGSFYSPHRPQLKCPDGRLRTVAFSRHAAERVRDRISADWFTYRGLGDCFARLASCVYFEPLALPVGNFAFSFFDACAVGFWEFQYAKEIIGASECDVPTPLYYRLGYCPGEYASTDEFVTATTLLPPGYRATPEAGVIEEASIGELEKSRLRDLLQKSFTRTDLERNGDFSALRWLHHNGVPQVFKLPFTVYKNSPIHTPGQRPKQERA